MIDIGIKPISPVSDRLKWQYKKAQKWFFEWGMPDKKSKQGRDAMTGDSLTSWELHSMGIPTRPHVAM